MRGNPLASLSEAEYLQYVRLELTDRHPFIADLNQLEWGQLLWEACRDDFFFWQRWFGIIVDESQVPGVVHRGLTLWPGQRNYCELYLGGRSVIAGKARQTGISWNSTNGDYWEMEFHDNVGCSVMAQTDDYAKKHLFRLRQVRDNQPNCIKRKPGVMGFDNQHTLGLGAQLTMSLCECLMSTPDAARGITRRRVRWEEMAHCEKQEETLAALQGGLADGSRQLVPVSTANGESNAYHRLWLMAVAGTVNMVPFFMPWHAHPGRSAAFREEQEAVIGTALAMQEFPATPEEMFISSGFRVFDGMTLKALREKYCREPIRVEQNGQLEIYADPVPGRAYCSGWDIANGGGDATSGDIMDVLSGEQVARWSSHVRTAGQVIDSKIEPADAARIAVDLCKRYNWAMLAWEDNNMGVAFGAEAMRHCDYPHLYRRQNETAPDREKFDTKPGWLTTTATRGKLFGGLQKAISAAHRQVLGQLEEKAQGEPFILRSAETYRQLGICVYSGPNNKPVVLEPDHDDAIMSAGICEQARQYVLNHSRAPMIFAV